MHTQKAKTKVKNREREKGFIAKNRGGSQTSQQDGAEQGPYKGPELDCCGVGRGSSLPCSFTTTEMINVLHFCPSERGNNTISF